MKNRLVAAFVCGIAAFSSLNAYAKTINGCVIGNYADCHGIDLSGVNLDSHSFRGANLDGVKFDGASLKNLDFRAAYFWGAPTVVTSFENTSFRNADLNGADFNIFFDNESFALDLSSADFRGAKVAGANFYGANLSGLDLKSTTFVGNANNVTNLRDVNLSQADMRGVKLNGVTLVAANFGHANMHGVDFTGATIGDGFFSGQGNTDFSFADMSNTKLFFNINPAEYLRLHGNVMPVNFTGANMNGAYMLTSWKPYANRFNTDISGINWVSNPVPEPETYAMMLAGLGVVGWSLRKRKLAIH